MIQKQTPMLWQENRLLHCDREISTQVLRQSREMVPCVVTEKWTPTLGQRNRPLRYDKETDPYTLVGKQTPTLRQRHIHQSGVLTALTWLLPHESSAISAQSVYTLQPCTMSLHESHIRKVHACLAVTCHLHFWQNDRNLLRASAVTAS